MTGIVCLFSDGSNEEQCRDVATLLSTRMRQVQNGPSSTQFLVSGTIDQSQVRDGLVTLLELLKLGQLQSVAVNDAPLLMASETGAQIVTELLVNGKSLITPTAVLRRRERPRGEVKTHSRRGEQIKNAHAHQLLCGGIWMGNVPFGYTRVYGPPLAAASHAAAAQVAIDSTAASIVRAIFSHFADEGWSLTDIARSCTDRQILVSTRRDSSTVWNIGTVKYILRNSKYVGRWLWQQRPNTQCSSANNTTSPRDGSPIVLDWPHLRIVDDKTWHQAQMRLDDYRPQYKGFATVVQRAHSTSIADK